MDTSKKQRLLNIILGLTFILGLSSSSHAFADPHFLSLDKKVSRLAKTAPNIDPKVLRLALVAYTNAHRKLGVDQQGILTVVDYSKPDNQKRLWVFDLNNNRLLINTWIAHGVHSGGVYGEYFSNRPQSLESSIGLYLTENAYYGSLGYSLRLRGLDKGYNDNAYDRAIVMHGAWYVSSYYAEHYGRIGRSWGCLAMAENIAPKVINTVKDGTLIFAYAPNYFWEHSSPFLQT